MKNESSLITKEGHTEQNTHPGFSIDCVLITYHNGKIKVLLRDFGLEDYKALLGGFIFNDESADQAVLRILESYTGFKNVYLKQLALFSDPNRTILKQNADYVDKYATAKDDGKWLLRRFISMGYFALVKYSDIKDLISKQNRLKWYDIQNLPRMYSDHENIINTALTSMRTIMPIIAVANELLPEKFLMTDLRKIHEVFFNKVLDRRNFQRKMLSAGNIVQLEERKSEKIYNAPILYSFKSLDIEDS